MNNEKTCLHCNSKFVSEGHNAKKKYCSHKCSIEHTKYSREKANAYNRERRRKLGITADTQRKNCDYCTKLFTSKRYMQKYCCKLCQEKARYEREKVTRIADVKHRQKENPELFKQYKRKSINKLKAGKLILDLYLKKPTWGSKMVWNGLGRWSKKFSECQACHTTVYKHDSKGLCRYCYIRINRDPLTTELNNKARKWNKDFYYESAAQRRNEVREIYKKIKSGQIEISPEIQNILNNLPQTNDT